VNLLWIRPAAVEQEFAPDERRIREFVDSPGGVSESAMSLAAKLEIGPRRCRSILERLVEQGVVERKDYADMEPMYFRFPTR
jgi:predicted ArsR family transcriptional regulator